MSDDPKERRRLTLIQALQEAMGSLERLPKHRDRVVLELYEKHRMTTREIAEAVGVVHATVVRWLQAARKERDGGASA